MTFVSVSMPIAAFGVLVRDCVFRGMAGEVEKVNVLEAGVYGTKAVTGT
jgi:hypothetical protein